MSIGRQELLLHSLVHAINWLRSVVNVYHDQVTAYVGYLPHGSCGWSML